MCQSANQLLRWALYSVLLRHCWSSGSTKAALLVVLQLQLLLMLMVMHLLLLAPGGAQEHPRDSTGAVTPAAARSSRQAVQRRCVTRQPHHQQHRWVLTSGVQSCSAKLSTCCDSGGGDGCGGCVNAHSSCGLSCRLRTICCSVSAALTCCLVCFLCCILLTAHSRGF
jgi:hypothetical protein